LSAQPNLSVLYRRLLAALSLVVAATLAASAPGFGGRSGLQNANAVDRTILSGLRGLIEDGEPQHPDAASGDPRIKARPSAAQRIVTPEPPRNGYPPVDVSGAPRTYAARAGLTRAPPLA
jgi:hypothetical protein